ncbi:MAG: EpsI family protein, partial [Proteobacteria bacterium]|nr:EpsI family protein [Pseudomonadota bacterium]
MFAGYRFIIVFVLLIAAAVFVHTHEDLAVPSARPLTEIAVRQGGWVM